MTKTRILGVDFGHARIGLAISDPMRIIASPLDTIEGHKSVAKCVESLVSQIDKLKREKGYIIGEMVIGLPLNMDGTESERSHTVRQFAAGLEEALKLPIHLSDERLSSVQADRALMETGYSRKKRAQVVDRLSAVIILQTYLTKTGSV